MFKGTLIGSPVPPAVKFVLILNDRYQEIYTDPSYTGQIIVTTTSYIGNYGVIDSEVESDHPTIAGISQFFEIFSRIDASGLYRLPRQIWYHRY